MPFRDPLNQARRSIPLRLDDAPIKGSLAQFLYINWLPADGEQEYAKLLEACGPGGSRISTSTRAAEPSIAMSADPPRPGAEPSSAKTPWLVPVVHAVSPNQGQSHAFRVLVENRGTTTADTIQLTVKTSHAGLPYFSPGFWSMGACHAPYSFKTKHSLNPKMHEHVFGVGFQQDPDEISFAVTISARDLLPQEWEVKFSREESRTLGRKDGSPAHA